MRPQGWDILGRALGLDAEVVVAALGEPASRRTDDSDLWLAFEAPGRRLLLRCEASGEGWEVVAWTLSFDAGPPTLREAAEPHGLWPACRPDVAAAGAREPLIRRAVPGARTGDLHSLTASVRGDRFERLALFNERPEWL